jgi:hypothetical protein
MKILTPTGFQNFHGIIRKKSECLKIFFEDSDIICSTDHRFDEDGKEIVASSLKAR